MKRFAIIVVVACAFLVAGVAAKSVLAASPVACGEKCGDKCKEKCGDKCKEKCGDKCKCDGKCCDKCKEGCDGKCCDKCKNKEGCKKEGGCKKDKAKEGAAK